MTNVYWKDALLARGCPQNNRVAGSRGKQRSRKSLFRLTEFRGVKYGLVGYIASRLTVASCSGRETETRTGIYPRAVLDFHR